MLGVNLGLQRGGNNIKLTAAFQTVIGPHGLFANHEVAGNNKGPFEQILF